MRTTAHLMQERGSHPPVRLGSDAAIPRDFFSLVRLRESKFPALGKILAGLSSKTRPVSVTIIARCSMTRIAAKEIAKKAHSVKSTALMLSCSEPHIRNLIRSGKLRAKLMGRRVLILEVDLQQYLDGLKDWYSASKR